MKKLNKKGFTIVELVIVIAVIAILAAVLIPTFSGAVEKANESSRLQSAHNAYTAVVLANDAEFDEDKWYFVIDSKNYIVDDGEIKAAPSTWTVPTAGTNQSWVAHKAADTPDTLYDDLPANVTAFHLVDN